jgi:uncharacterized protein YceK
MKMILIITIAFCGCSHPVKKTEPLKKYKVQEGNELIDKIAQSAKLSKADA